LSAPYPYFLTLPTHLTDPNPLPAAADRATERMAAQRRLLIDVCTVQAVQALAGDGIRAILLKGPAVATWLYEEGESRGYVDADLLVEPANLSRAGRVLSRSGFQRLTDERVIDAFAEPHAVTWRREDDRAMVDLHWRLPGIAADPPTAWERLSSGTEEVSVSGTPVEALGKPARAVHLALHALNNGREGVKAMSDLARGIERIDEPTWRAAAALAADLEATVPFAAGLRMTREGGLLADSLGLPRDVGTRWALWAQTPPPGAVRLHQLAETRGIRVKMRLLAAVLAPPPAYIRSLYPQARKGPAALVLAYVRRPLAGIRNAPRAIVALRRARAETRRARRGT
jgi:hypothetical protein